MYDLQRNRIWFIEIEISQTLSASHISNIKSLKPLFSKTKDYIIYSGTQEPVYHDVQFVNWQNVDSMIQ